MRLYVGQTRSGALIARLQALGVGEMTVRGELPPRRRPFAYDNGAFRDWKAGLPFDEPAFRADLDMLRGLSPDFIVCPDIVAGGKESLAISASWSNACRDVALAYIAVQDGMDPDEIGSWLHLFDGVFVGGSLPWKLRTSWRWVALAHEHRKPCHIGRVGTERRIRWAKAIGADSIDSCFPLWCEEWLCDALAALDAEPQPTLAGLVPA